METTFMTAIVLYVIGAIAVFMYETKGLEDMRQDTKMVLLTAVLWPGVMLAALMKFVIDKNTERFF